MWKSDTHQVTMDFGYESGMVKLACGQQAGPLHLLNLRVGERKLGPIEKEFEWAGLLFFFYI